MTSNRVSALGLFLQFTFIALTAPMASAQSQVVESSGVAGACCVDDTGTCIELTAGRCAAISSFGVDGYAGDGTNCDSAMCPPESSVVLCRLVERPSGSIRVWSDSAVVSVTAVDPCGNMAVCTVDLCAPVAH